MDKLACSMEFRTIFFIILYSYVSSQPIYEIHREDRVTTTRTELYYQKAYEREIFLKSQLDCLKRELDMCRDETPDLDLQKLTTKNPISDQNVTEGTGGNKFIVLFTKSSVDSTYYNVYVTAENGVHINITTSPYLLASLKSQIDRNVYISSSQRIMLPLGLELQSFVKEVKSVLIETSKDVFVVSHDEGLASAGSTSHIPLHKLSTRYVVISTKPAEPATEYPSQFAITAIKDCTTISITLRMNQNLPLKIEGNTYYNNGVFNISLNRFETYQIEHHTDLTGTSIESSFPIAAFSGNDCNRLGDIGYCDHLIKQLPPTDKVDKTYIVPPNSDDRHTIIRVTAIKNSNITYVIGNVTRTRSLNEFDSFDTKISSNQTCFIESITPILVTAFGVPAKTTLMGDPSMTFVPGLNQYIDYYKTVVPFGYVNNYVSVMIKHSLKDSFRINKTIINTGDVVFEENVSASNDTYNVRIIRVTEGELTASSLNGERFGLMFTGVIQRKAYGFSGNSLLL